MKLSTAIKILKDAGIEEATQEARYLFSHFASLSPASLYGTDPDIEEPRLVKAIDERAKRVPLQYIIGEVDFYRENYIVSKECLIPRSDTEILVEEVIKRLPDGARFIDICTGSGCIALSTLNNTKDTTAVAVDISDAALSIARKNADRLSLCNRVEFILKDALSEAIDGSFFAIISNPPYVTSSSYESLAPEIYFEPKIAFLGGEDGLDFYKRLIPLYKSSLASDGFFAFEIGYDQGDALCRIAEENGMTCKIIKDYSDNPRVAILTK